MSSPRALQRRSVRSVDEVSTAWSLSTICRLEAELRTGGGMKEGISGRRHWIILLPLCLTAAAARAVFHLVLMVCLRPSHTVFSTTCFIQCKMQPRLGASEIDWIEPTGERSFFSLPPGRLTAAAAFFFNLLRFHVMQIPPWQSNLSV